MRFIKILLNIKLVEKYLYSESEPTGNVEDNRHHLQCGYNMTFEKTKCSCGFSELSKKL